MAQSEPHHGNAGQWPKYSGFKALQSDRKEIRLIRLEPGTSSDDLQYVMHHAELGDKPKYCAVIFLGCASARQRIEGNRYSWRVCLDQANTVIIPYDHEISQPRDGFVD